MWTPEQTHYPSRFSRASFGLAVMGEMMTAEMTAKVGGRLAASLTNTNSIESMILIARDTTSNVKWWRDGKVIKRWCAAGMLNTERRFRRLKGYRQVPTLVAALARHVEAVRAACDAARVAGADERTPHRPVVATGSWTL